MKSFSRAVLSGLLVLLSLALPGNTRAALLFNFTSDAGMSQDAIDGFAAAAQLWSSVLTDDITINLSIGFQSLPTGVIGSTSTNFAAVDYSTLRSAMLADATSLDDSSAYSALQSGTSYSRLINHTSNNPAGLNSAIPYVDSLDWVGVTTANARALGFSLPEGTQDGRIVFSSSFAFDFTHNSIDPGKLDFVGAAAHEIGHVLGFVSGVDDIDYAAGANPDYDFSCNVIDLFRFSAQSIAAGPGFLDYTADQRTKYFSVDGGVTSIAAFATGVHYGDGRQASHWKDNLALGMMDPTASYGERISISDIDLRAMDVLGYERVPEPGSALLLTLGFTLLVSRRTARARRH